MKGSSVDLLAGGGILVVCLVVAPAQGSAQAAGDSCVLRITPGTVDAGPAAVRVTARFSRDIGPVRALESPAGSGVDLTSRRTLERIGLLPAEDAERPGAAEAADRSARETVWLDLVAARAGTHRITLLGETGSCTGTLTVGEGGAGPVASG